MDDLEKDWNFLRAALPDLQEYLLSDKLYWPLSGRVGERGESVLQLTPGNLLLALKRLRSFPWPAARAEELEKLADAFHQTRDRWLSNWRRKVEKELPVRLKRWAEFLGESGKSGTRDLPVYRYEVRIRVILQLLLDELVNISTPSIEQIRHLDLRLRAVTQVGEFVWQPELADGFAAEDFWYLYVTFGQGKR